MKTGRKRIGGQLYAETLRRLLFAGIVAAAVFSLVCAMISIDEVRRLALNGEAVIIRIVDDRTGQAPAADMAPVRKMNGEVLAFLSSCLSPFFVFGAFSFARRKKEADFYGALPCTRTEVFFSTLAGALTVSIAVSITAFLAVCVPYAISPRFAVDWLAELSDLGVTALNAVILGGFAAIAAALTGRLFPSVVTFALILLAEYSFRDGLSLIVERLPTLQNNPAGLRFSAEWYLPFSVGRGARVYGWDNLLFGVGSSPEEVFAFDAPRLIYHLCAASLGILAAWLLFRNRRTDAAGERVSSPGNYLVLRAFLLSYAGLLTAKCLITFVPFNFTTQSYYFTFQEALPYIFLFLLAVFLFCLLTVLVFEGGLRQALKRRCRAWLLLLCVPLSLGFCLGAYACTVRYFDEEEIPAERIASVEMPPYWRSMNADLLERGEVKEWQKAEFLRAFEQTRAMGRELHGVHGDFRLYAVTVTMTDGSTRYRSIACVKRPTPEEAPQMRMLREVEGLAERYVRMPSEGELCSLIAELSDRETGTQQGGMELLILYEKDPAQSGTMRLTEDGKELYRLFLREWDAAPTPEKIRVLSALWVNCSYSRPDEYLMLSLGASGASGRQIWAESLYFPPELLPETAARIRELIALHGEEVPTEPPVVYDK